MTWKLSREDSRALVAEMRDLPGEGEYDHRHFDAGALAAIQCAQRGGNPNDGVTVSETGGHLKRWRPGYPAALEGWEWMWGRISHHRMLTETP